VHEHAKPPDLLTTYDVAALVGRPLHEVTWWVIALRPSKRYTRFLLARRGGGDPRTIHAPIKPIKQMQRRLLEAFLPAHEPTLNVHGFIKGRSPISNARPHLAQTSVLRVDLKDFFPSIHFGRVRGLFRAFPFDYPPDVAQLLAQICCHESVLPQGAPTSPLISNLVCRALDRDLAQLARDERCYFTRYADDLTFSTMRREFPVGLADIDKSGALVAGKTLRDVIAEHDFTINDPKTRLTRYSQRQRVTGLVVNERLNVSRDYIRDLRSVLHIWKRYGIDDAEARFKDCHPLRNAPPDKPEPQFSQIIAGRIQYVGSVKGWSDPVYRRLANQLSELDNRFEPRTLRILETETVQQALLYTEGKTDPLHLLAAQAYFHAKGDFSNLELAVEERTPAGSGNQLLELTEKLAATRQEIPCVSVFDSDEPTILDAAVGPTLSRNHGNRVGAVAARHPDWRDDSAPLCIEMLYQDADLQKLDANGRRIYLRGEFNTKTGFHRTEAVNTPHPKNKTLVCDEVYKHGSEDNLALSKIRFAEAIETGTPPYDDVDFEGFRPTFEAIRDLVARVL
jgi:RNA-directed DNA polymerase